MNLLSSARTLILDGAMGTELMRRKIQLPLPLWSADANATHPEEVLAIHNEYVNAGADIITANTFRTTPWSYQRAGYSPDEALTLAHDRMQQAVALATKAANGTKMVAGSIAPLEECYDPALVPEQAIVEKEFYELYSWLIMFGADIILFETMGSIIEIKSAINTANKFQKTSLLSLLINNESTLFDGTPLTTVYQLLSAASFDTILFNCTTLDSLPGAIDLLQNYWTGKWGIYPTLGTSMPAPGGEFEKIESDEVFIRHVDFYIKKNAKIIGTCCGSTPRHTKLIKDRIEASEQNG